MPWRTSDGRLPRDPRIVNGERHNEMEEAFRLGHMKEDADQTDRIHMGL